MIQTPVDVREANYVKVGNAWERIVSKWGIGKNGKLAKPSEGGFGVVTETGKKINMWEAQAYGLKDEIEEVAERMYHECYIGHIDWEQWRKFAAFAISYAKEKA